MSITQVKATVNGSDHLLTYNSGTGTWTAIITAPAGSSYNKPGRYYGVTVTATDDAGNTASVDDNDPTLGQNLRLIVVEQVIPAINITFPGDDAFLTTDMPTVLFELRDDLIGGDGDSGINLTSWSMTIDGGTPITSQSQGFTYTEVDGGYDCTYTPPAAWSNSSHTIVMNVKDNDRNSALTATRTFTIDTVPPELNITHPSEHFITNQESLTITGVTNGSSGSPVTITVTLGGVDQGEVIVDHDTGLFSKSVTLTEGENVIVITATDAAGKTSVINRTVTLSTTLPNFTLVELSPNPVDGGKTYTITVTVV